MTRFLRPTFAVLVLSLAACLPSVHAVDGITLQGRGRVQSVDAPRQRFVVRLTRLPKPLTLAWAEDTEFKRAERPVPSSALEPGQEIEIRYRLSSDGSHHARRILILSAPVGSAETGSHR